MADETFDQTHATEYGYALTKARKAARDGNPEESERWLRLAERHLIVVQRLNKVSDAQRLREANGMQKMLASEESYNRHLLRCLQELDVDKADIREALEIAPDVDRITNWRGKPQRYPAGD